MILKKIIYHKHNVNLFGEDLNVTDVHLYVEVPHGRFNNPHEKIKCNSNLNVLAVHHLAVACLGQKESM